VVHPVVGLGPNVGLATGPSPSIVLSFLSSLALEAF
jgi:hypothetical protein